MIVTAEELRAEAICAGWNRLRRAIDDVQLGRSIHNDRFPSSRIEGPVWSEFAAAYWAMRDIVDAALTTSGDVT